MGYACSKVHTLIMCVFNVCVDVCMYVRTYINEGHPESKDYLAIKKNRQNKNF